MTKLEKIKEILKKKDASLVVAYENGNIQDYYQDRIKDLVSIVKENEQALNNSMIADKVVGKVAASIMAVAGIRELYAETLSKIAIPVLENANIQYSYGTLVDYIKNRDQSGMCPMEAKYKDETDITKVYQDMVKS